jgi:CheY-like chemotaxis protein
VPHLLIASDADWVIAEVEAALAGRGTTIAVCRRGQDVAAAVEERKPDLAVLDMQIGNMGAFAVTLMLHNEESGGRLPHVRTLILLDRAADVFLAQRSEAEGWLLKPLDALRLRRAAKVIQDGGTYRDGSDPAAASLSA